MQLDTSSSDKMYDVPSAYVSIKKLAAYCLDYARLVSPIAARTSQKTDELDKELLDVSLLSDTANEDRTAITLPINLDLEIEKVEAAEEEIDPIDQPELIAAEEEIKNLDPDSKVRQQHLKYAQQLEDLHRKFLTTSFTKELMLEYGFISFKTPGPDPEEIHEPLLRIPVHISKHDHAGKRKYSLEIVDDTVSIHTGFLNRYVSSEYYDQIFTFVASSEGSRANELPLAESFVDELWSLITHLLKLSEVNDLSEAIDLDHSRIALQPRANYFLSQDLLALSEISEDDLESTSLSAWTSEEAMSLQNQIHDDGTNELFFPFAYDRWQLQVLGIIENRSAIVEGPPGTGKSQTIANLLCHLAAQGKKVLFVSQKDQAIRGVKDTLKNLEIPSLYGYIPDRNSVLHTQTDEEDSAAHSLVSLVREWATESQASQPQEDLQTITATIPKFNEAIEQERRLYSLYEELRTLEKYDFEHTSVSAEWWKIYTHSLSSIDKLQKIIKDYSSRSPAYLEAYDPRYSLLEVSYKDIYEALKETISKFNEAAFDRTGLKRKLKDMSLKHALSQSLSGVPIEIYNDVLAIALSDETKAMRKSKLIGLHNYFVFCFDRQQLSDYQIRLENLISSASLSVEDLTRLEGLVKENGADNTFRAIEKHRELYNAIKTAQSFNANHLRAQIMEAKLSYRDDTVNYIRNRIRQKLEIVRAQKQARAVLERIAHSLNKSKRAYKTFDKLKSNPENFDVMSSVVPVWLMSLDDASRILPMQPNVFDYVVVDEASQCNIAYALPVMYRAKHSIFFGDTLQMRDTTTLFKANEQLSAIALKHGIADEYQIKANEDSVKSVMDIAALAGFQKTALQYHYRSPKELIGFSNEYIYKKNGRGLQVINDNCLVYKDTGRVMVNHLVESRPDLDVSEKTNIAEALYIKQLIATLRADPATADKSIAVLSFFNEQAELLRKVIENQDIKVAIIDGIQGDERDIIIYSFVISSPDQKMRYVALTGEGGEIRKESNEGRVPYLWPDGIWIKRYLEYIDKNGIVRAHHDANEQKFDSKFESSVYEYLAQILSPKDYTISTQVKSCGFFIDIVIQNKKTNKRLALECDGPTHFEPGDGQVYVTNDFERETVLRTAGWTLYRLPYLDWQEDTALTKRDIQTYFEQYFSVHIPKKAESAIPESVNNDTAIPMLETQHVDIPENLIASLKEVNKKPRGRFR
jgi:very-short-patch-repair endonuclease